MLAETNDEEAQKFDSMLQSKQDEIMLESLKVKFFPLGLITCYAVVNRQEEVSTQPPEGLLPQQALQWNP